MKLNGFFYLASYSIFHHLKYLSNAEFYFQIYYYNFHFFYSVKFYNTFNFGGKLTYAGGRWYGPADEAASAEALEVIYVDEHRNSIQFQPYFRLDGKITYTINKPKLSHEIGIDFVNMTNTQNILTLTYAPDHPSGNPIQEEYQLGFLPIFYYKIDF